MKKIFHNTKAIVASDTSILLVMFLVLLFLLFTCLSATAATKTSTGNGNWSASGTWSPAGRPAAGDDVVIRSGDIVTIDSIFICNNLTIGNNTNADGTVQITSAANSLTINGDLQINPNSKNKTFVLDAGPGTINVAGTFSVWGYGASSSTSGIRVGSGSITFTPAITVSSAKQDLIFTGAGTMTFNAAFTDQLNELTTFAGCTVNFKSTYTVNTTAANWGGKGTAVFWNGSSITPTAAITFNNVSTNASASVTLNSGAGAVIVGGTFTLASGSTFTTNKSDWEVMGDWINNNGTFTGTNDTLTLNGTSGSIGGTSASTFRVLRIGRNAGSTAVGYTANNDVTCNYLRISTGSAARTLTLASGKTVTVNNDVLINQPTAVSTTASLSVNSGTCNVSGNLTFLGTSNTTSQVGQIAVTSGTFSLTGSVTWMSNTAVATEVITVSTGAITFGSSLTMAQYSGTLAVTSTGTINFNGASAPSLNFGGAATAPVFTTTNGCTLNFIAGITNNTNALTLAATSNTYFNNTSTITPNADITFGNVQVAASHAATLASGSGAVVVAGTFTLTSTSSFTANKDFQVNGDWTNNGGTLSAGSNQVIMNGTSQSIGGSSVTAFPVLRIGASSVNVACTLNNNSTCSSLVMDGSSNSRSLTLANGVTFNVSGNVTLNQPNGITTNNLYVNAATMNVSGNLIFAGTASAVNQVASINVTSGTFALTGTITWMTNSAVATEVITVSTGTLTFGTSVTMGSGSGTIAVTGTGTINFNGATVPSLNFGGATGPVFTTSSGCTVNFEKGFANTTTALTFATGSYINVGSLTSLYNLTIDPGTIVTNNGTTVIYGDLTASSAATFVNGTNAILEIRGAVSANVTLTATATGNTVKYKAGGAQTVKPTAYYNLTLDSADVKTCASGVSVNNDLTVQGAAAISNSAAVTVTGNFIYSSSASSTLGNSITAYGVTLSAGTLNDGGNTITINNSNGWNYNGGTFTTTGTVAFAGTTASVIAGSLPTTFNNLTINNSGGVTLSVSPASATAVSGTLNFTNGVLNTTASNIIRVLDNATTSSGSASSYVNGPMVKVGNDDFTFPTGKSGRWMRVAALGMTTATTEVTAEYFATPYTDTTSLSGSLTQVSQIEYWDVNRTVTTDPVKLKLFWEDLSQSTIINCDFLTIAHYVDGIWQEEPSTFTGTYCTGNASGSITMDGYVSTFSPFGFGGSGGQALPIKLVSFDAVVNGNVVQTNWITSLEINNDYFTVERSTDGSNFTEVGKVTGAGNSTTINTYQLIDENAHKGISYYRLRQTDFDGQYTYSNIVAVRIGEQTGTITLFPNPVEDQFYINVSDPSGEIQINVFDMLGKQVFQKTYMLDEESTNQTVSVATADILPWGMYLVNVSSNGVEFAQRLMIAPVR